LALRRSTINVLTTVISLLMVKKTEHKIRARLDLPVDRTAALVRWRRIRHGDGCRGVAFLLPIGDNVKIEYK
jgi:hypothetical protein